MVIMLVGAGAISILRGLKEKDFSDRFMRLVRVPASGGLGYKKPSYSEGGISYPCRFAQRAMLDVLPGTDVIMVEADLFFGRTVALDASDRVRITHIFNERVTATDYEIVAGPVLDSLGKTASLRLVRE